MFRFSTRTAEYMSTVHPHDNYSPDGNAYNHICTAVQSRLSLERLDEVNVDIARQLTGFVFEIASELLVTISAAERIELLPELMNFFLSDKKYLRDLLSLRMVCTTTRRRAFPIPSYRHIELPIGLIESFLGGEYASYIPLQYLSRALAILA